MKRTRDILELVVTICIVIALPACTDGAAGFAPFTGSNTTDTVTVGFATALSGSGAKWGEPVKEGFQYGIDQINSNGGVNGKQIIVEYKDDKCNGADGKNAFRQLTTLHNTDIIAGTVCSSVAMTVANHTEANDVLYIPSGATHPNVTRQGDKIFRLWVSDGYEAKELAEHATRALGLQRFAVGHVHDNPAGIALQRSFKQTVRANGGAITAVQSYGSDQKDFRTAIAKLLSDNPEGLYLMGTPSQTAPLVRQARQAGFDGPIFLYGPAATTESTQAAINDSGPIYYATPSWNKQGPFWTDFQNETGSEPGLLHALGYDTAMVIEEALRACGEDTDCMRAHLLSLDQLETTRGNVTFDDSGDLRRVPFTVHTVK